MLWNVAIIATLLVAGGRTVRRGAALAVLLAYGVVVGAACSSSCSCRRCCGCSGTSGPSLSTRASPVRQVLRSFGPVVLGRGVVQISAYVDTSYASLIAGRALAALAYAQTSTSSR